MAEPEQCVATAFRHERSVRRAQHLLAIKQRRIQDDLDQFLQHLTLLVPSAESTADNEIILQAVLEDALDRLGDQAFAAIVLQAFQRQQDTPPPGLQRRAS
ncbi:MAG: hypothetical protein ACO331_09960 [Prochlorothrix sp.]